MYLDLEWTKQPMVYTKHQTRSANLPKPPKIWASVLLSGLSYLDLLLSGPSFRFGREFPSEKILPLKGSTRAGNKYRRNDSSA